MMKRNYIFGIVGLVGATIFIGLMIIFALELHTNPNKLDLATKDTKIPHFSLPALLEDTEQIELTNTDLTSDKPYYLVNFWGSWCASCYAEHSYLLQLAQTQTIYGVNWKDERDNALRFIQRGGNPFTKIIVDAHSELAIGMGVYGAPETFLVTADGTIVYRYAGAMNASVWQEEFVPRINQLSGDMQ